MNPISEVQAKEKAKKAEDQRAYRKKRKIKKNFATIETGKGIIPRPVLPRKAKSAKKNPPSAYEVYVSLVDKLKMIPKEFEKQQSMLVESGTVRWMEHRYLGFTPSTPEPAREEKQFVMQIRSNLTSDWEDLLEVKASRLASKTPGLGLFACRPFQRGAVISLYAGVLLDAKRAPPKDIGEYNMLSHDGIFLDAQGSLDNKYAPFLGAQMANDPTWLPPVFIPGQEPPQPSSLESLANCRFNDDFTFVASKQIMKSQELLTLYHLLEQDSDSTS
jgi:hypothetical protein